MARLTLPVGQTDFRDIRTGGCYYVDKTEFIGQIAREGASSILFTRPRRFGKTTFQSMLKAFFDIREDNRDIFTGLAIMDDEEAVEGTSTGLTSMRHIISCPLLYPIFTNPTSFLQMSVLVSTSSSSPRF